MRRKRGLKLLAGLFGFALLAAACGDDSGNKTTGSGSESSESSASEAVPDGGTLTLGAEQEPDCMDWMGSCGGSSWGYWMVGVQTMPRAFDTVKEGDSYVNKVDSMLKGEPKLETSPKQKVTYEISDEAVWDDGTPITSTDFKYTWDQVAHGSDIYDTTGFKDIESVDDSNPKVAVVTFSKNYADWKSLFGGQYGIFPSHILQGQDRDAMMKDGYKFSGGPWKLDSWAKGDSITLVPNPNFWGQKPHLDKVIFKIQADTAAEFQSFKTNQVLAIYPQPQIDVIDAINAGLPDANTDYTTETGNFEMLWINNSQPPFDSKTVREALAYSVDRDAIVKALFGGIGVDKALQVANAPISKDYTDTEAFSKYKLDLDKAKSILEGDGWTKGSDGIYAKGGQKLTFTIKSTAGNKRRELTEQVLQQQLKTAGFDMQIDNQKAGDLFGDILPKGDFQMALYASVLTGLTPGMCTQFCSENIPSDANQFSGQNWTRTNIPELDAPLKTVDESLDENERKDAGKKADGIMADNVPVLPLDPLPNILLWSKSIVGPVGESAILGPFYNMNEWGLKQ